MEQAMNDKPELGPVLTVESLERMFKQIEDDDRERREQLIEWGRKYREGSPEYRRQREAQDQACAEIVGRYPDPLNPIIVHPDTQKQIAARVKEILNER
jgi:hypothetical protein